jgi:L-alanine-DL-glutamate epimerase-like enolase superfamily enzyme
MNSINKISRRNFLKSSALAGAAGFSGIFPLSLLPNRTKLKKITVQEVNSNFEREPLLQPFGFKGGYITELWQTIMYLQSASGFEKVGLATQSVLWSDASVFASHSESGGNSLMYALSEYALQQLKGITFANPVNLLDAIFEDVYRYGQKITGNPNLRKTFALNALVGVDNAAWLLYAAENGIDNFDDLIPPEYRPALSHHHDSVSSIPLMAYNVPISEIKKAAEDGYFFLKIKIGQPGTQDEMLQKDIDRLSAIHQTIGHYQTPHTQNGKLYYYLDANGRYEKKETLLKLIGHIQKIGAFDQVAIIEEPFPESTKIDVSDIPIRLAADESAHTVNDALERIEMGYKAIALKAIAKTLSMTLKIADAAKQHQVPCFCADLTVNPILVDWNKNVAARLAPFPGLKSGLLESNGFQNYTNWKQMEKYHPFPDSSWQQTSGGMFHLGEDFYSKSGGVLTDSAHYMNKFKNYH